MEEERKKETGRGAKKPQARQTLVLYPSALPGTHQARSGARRRITYLIILCLILIAFSGRACKSILQYLLKCLCISVPSAHDTL